MKPAKKKTRAQKVKEADALLLRAALLWWRIWSETNEDTWAVADRLGRAIEARLKLEGK